MSLDKENRMTIEFLLLTYPFSSDFGSRSCDSSSSSASSGTQII